MNFTNTCKPCNQGKENNILTAKEWLEKEGKLNGVCNNNPDYKGLSYSASEAMELYASYKTKVLEDRIGEFKDKLDYVCNRQGDISAVACANLRDWMKEFDKHFNIN